MCLDELQSFCCRVEACGNDMICTAGKQQLDNTSCGMGLWSSKTSNVHLGAKYCLAKSRSVIHFSVFLLRLMGWLLLFLFHYYLLHPFSVTTDFSDTTDLILMKFGKLCIHKSKQTVSK